MTDVRFVFKNCLLSKILVRNISFIKKDVPHIFTFGKSDAGSYMLCTIHMADRVVYHQPTTCVQMALAKDTVVVTDFCSCWVEADGTLCLKIKKPYRFNPFLVLDKQYVKSWGRLFFGLGSTFRFLDREIRKKNDIGYKSDPSLLASSVLNTLFLKACDPQHLPKTEMLLKPVKNMDHEAIEHFLLPTIASTCMFRPSARNLLTVIKGMYK